MNPKNSPSDLPMLKSPPIMGEARHFLDVYYSNTAAEGTRASRDAKSEYWEGGAAGEAATTGSFSPWSGT